MKYLIYKDGKKVNEVECDLIKVVTDDDRTYLNKKRTDGHPEEIVAVIPAGYLIIKEE